MTEPFVSEQAKRARAQEEAETFDADFRARYEHLGWRLALMEGPHGMSDVVPDESEPWDIGG